MTDNSTSGGGRAGLSATQRAALAARLRRGRTGGGADEIPRRPPGDTDLPLSFGQEQLWFLDRYAPGQATYNVPGAIVLAGPLDPAALGRALDALVARHEALRTRLVTDADGRPRQVVDPPAPVPLEHRDFSGPDAGAGRDEAWRRAVELIRAETARPFDLSEGPLLRAVLVRLAPDDHVLLYVVHHVVFDGWSGGVLRSDLAALYRAEATGGESGLAELPVQFADYARWERTRLAGGHRDDLEEYWRGALDGVETLHLPTDRPRPALIDPAGAEVFRSLPAEMLDGLRELARGAGSTLFVTMLAALNTLLHRWSGQTDVVVGTVSANRTRAVLAPMIGYLVNTLPIRVDLSGDPAFTELLARVREATVGAFAHQDLPLGALVDAVGVPRDPSRTPLFQVAYSQVDAEGGDLVAAGVEFALPHRMADTETTKFDMSFIALAGDGEFAVAVHYATALFDADTVARLLGNLEVLLRGVLADPSARLSELPLLTDAELRRELVEWNDTAADLPGGLVHGLFEEQVARTPDAVAAEFGDERVSYADLNRRANRIARALRDLGVGPERLVGVCLGAGPWRIAALLGIMKAGGGYLALDERWPAERLAFVMADSGMAAAVTDTVGRGLLPETAVPLLDLDADRAAVDARDATNLSDVEIAPSGLAYVIYTSGSTGRPKGVVIEHRNVVNYVRVLVDLWSFGPSERVLQFSALSFDASVMDIFMTLSSGGRLVLADTDTLHSPPRLAALIRDRRVSWACLTPAVLALLVGEEFPDLRMLLAGGEEVSSELARAWAGRGPVFINSYGPTETTVTTTHATLTPDTPLPPPIGRPLPNYRNYVLDAHLHPVPVGVPGELHVGGAGVARGYLNRPELTDERFIPDPFVPGERLYKTGDLVRRRPDGTIVFLGRTDHQVKLRGLRIELGEIETTLAAHPSVAQAVVTIAADRTGDRQLVGYLRPAGDPPDPAELRTHLARTLPGYMIPTHLITVDRFTLNTSGKIDRSALPSPADVTPVGGAATEPAPPATLTEAALVDDYARLLDRERVRATDSFFDVGGNSLRAMQLVAAVHAGFGVDLAVTEIFLHPTPRRLAARIDAARAGDGGTNGSAAGPVVPLSAGVGELPLLMVHPVGGTVLGYAPLARELAGTFAVRGLQSPALAGGTVDLGPDRTLSDLADDYLALVRADQPTGPYRLAGWSMGGVLAYELARRLERDGAEVALLALLDPPFAVPAGAVATETGTAAGFVADAARGLGVDPAGAPPGAAAEQIDWLAARLGADGPAIPDRLRAGFAVFRAHRRMMAGYRPATGLRAPTLVVSADRSPNAPTRELWPTVLGGPVGIATVDGDHYTFLQPPLVAEVGTALLKWHDAHG